MSDCLTWGEFLDKYHKPYRGLGHIFWPDKGFIVWRLGTGQNTELLHIRSFVPRQGYGKELLKEMLRQINPYYSVFGFGLQSRSVEGFYQKMGFRIIPMPGPTKDEGILFWQSFEKLRGLHGV